MERSKIVQKLNLYTALTDATFAKEVFRKLPMSSFDTETEKNLAQEIKRYYIINSDPMTEEELTAYIEGHIEEGLDPEKAFDMVDLIDEVYDVKEGLGDEVASKELEKHVRRHLTLDVLKGFIASEGLDDEEELAEVGNKLVEISLMDITNRNDDNFLDLLNDTDKKIRLYKKLRRKTYPTGFSNIDSMLDGGGMGKGEVALMIAPSGKGKTSFAIQAATNALRQGLNVLYITLEEKMERLAIRIESNLLGIPQNTFYNEMGLINEEFIEATKAGYESQDDFGNLYVSKQEPKDVSIEKLEKIIMEFKIRQGKDIDYVVIDYPALMRTSFRTESGSDEGGELFERIRGLSQKYDFTCLTLAQTNRSAWGADIITAENIEGSKKVINACELVLTMNRKEEEYENQFFRLHVDKVRNVRDGANLPNMLSFKVNTQGYVMRASTLEEQEEHTNILRNAGESDGDDGFSVAANTVDNINSMI